MNTGVLDSISFPYPNIKLQNKYLMEIKGIDDYKMILRRGLSLLEQNYNVLMQQFFN
jgi:hypothetical protein